MLDFQEVENRIERSDVVLIESRFGITFPVSYVAHILMFNGGRPTRNVVRFLEKGRKSSSDVDWFLAIHKGPYDNLERCLEMYLLENRLPEETLPFAHDSGGNLYCFREKGKEGSRVYFWNHEEEPVQNSEPLSLVSSSFEEFLISLETDTWPLVE